MARGIEVLQAALSGKRVRQLIGPNRSEWLRWSGSGIVGEDGGARSLAVRELWEGDWEIDEPTLTFAEAVAAMDAGQTVERGVFWIRRQGSAEKYEYSSDQGISWHDCDAWDFGDFHATDWRIVREALVQGVNVPDLTMFIREKSEWRLPPSVAEEMAEALLQRWVQSAKDDNTPEG